MRVRLQVTLQLPRDTATVGKVRRVLTGAMAALGVVDGDADDIRLIVTEACTNVIKHADEVDEYTVTVELSTAGCVLEVSNVGRPVDPRLWSVALPGGSTAEYGRGPGRSQNVVRLALDRVSHVSVCELCPDLASPR